MHAPARACTHRSHACARVAVARSRARLDCGATSRPGQAVAEATGSFREAALPQLLKQLKPSKAREDRKLYEILLEISRERGEEATSAAAQTRAWSAAMVRLHRDVLAPPEPEGPGEEREGAKKGAAVAAAEGAEAAEGASAADGAQEQDAGMCTAAGGDAKLTSPESADANMEREIEEEGGTPEVEAKAGDPQGEGGTSG